MKQHVEKLGGKHTRIQKLKPHIWQKPKEMRMRGSNVFRGRGQGKKQWILSKIFHDKGLEKVKPFRDW